MKILALSDTHGLLRPQVEKMLGECDAVIHAGDFQTKEIETKIQGAVGAGVPLFMVRIKQKIQKNREGKIYGSK